MSLKNKLTYLLILCGIIFIVFFFSAFNLIIRPSLEEQKLIFIETLQTKINIALNLEIKEIPIITNWADWESMINYLDHPSSQFETEVFPDNLFAEESMEFVVISNFERDDILFAKAYKEKTVYSMRSLQIREEINRIKYNIRQNPDVSHNEILNTGIGPVMIVAQPIYSYTEPVKKIKGILVMGRFIQQKMLTRISRNIVVTVHLMSLNQNQLYDFYARKMHGKELHYEEVKDKLNVYYLLKDIHDKPAAVLFISNDNELFNIVRQRSIVFLLITLISIIILGSLLYFAIETQIVKRVMAISTGMKKIEGLKDLSKRIDDDLKHDELSYLVTNFNSMLDKLEQERVKRETAERAMITHSKLASIGRLTSSIAHEVNNPLLAISNSIQVIKKISRSKSELFQEALEISESEISRIREIIASLLDFHRLEKEEYSQLNAVEIVQKSLDVLRWSKKMGDTKVIQKVENDCWVYGSPVKLKQVFINFILNAVEAMEFENNGKPGLLQIEVRNCTSADSKTVEIHFIDNGPGIPEEVSGHMFEPFVSTKGVKGVGLGLYVSYKIIRNHNGEIIYYDKYKDGTHFIIKLPNSKRFQDE